MNNPLISVIIPCHNNEKTLEESVLSIVAQTYKNIEIIIVDDFSTDTSVSIARQLVDTYKQVFAYQLPVEDPNRFNAHGRNINAGYSARNYAFTKINGDWITFQDADDTSMRNRIEAQLRLAEKYDAIHLCLDWQRYADGLTEKMFDIDSFMQTHDSSNMCIDAKTIQTKARKTKGIAFTILGPIARYVPFNIKTAKYIHKLFFRSLEPYPGTGNSPLFKKEVLQKVQFRQRDARVWPSFVGRGADRDFNFQVAETFGKSCTVLIPLYLWRQDMQNPRYNETLGRFHIMQ